MANLLNPYCSVQEVLRFLKDDRADADVVVGAINRASRAIDSYTGWVFYRKTYTSEPVFFGRGAVGRFKVLPSLRNVNYGFILAPYRPIVSLTALYDATVNPNVALVDGVDYEVDYIGGRIYSIGSGAWSTKPGAYKITANLGLDNGSYVAPVAQVMNIVTTEAGSSTNVILLLNGDEILDTYLDAPDTDYLGLLLMVALNGGTTGLPSALAAMVSGLTVHLPSHDAVCVAHTHPVSAVMNPSDGSVARPDVVVTSTVAGTPFTLYLDNPYSTAVTTVTDNVPLTPYDVTTPCDESVGMPGDIHQYAIQMAAIFSGFWKKEVFTDGSMQPQHFNVTEIPPKILEELYKWRQRAQ